jgi:insertion element IS1 protein InsB
VNQRPPVRPGYVPDPAAGLRLCADEMWSFVRSKKGQRWLWWVEDAATGQVLAFVFGRRTHATFRRLQAVLAAAGWVVERWLTDAWGAYQACLPAEQRQAGKAPLQRLERKHLTLRTRLKRLTRKTICFSKKQFFHDGLITLFIFRFFF